MTLLFPGGEATGLNELSGLLWGDFQSVYSRRNRRVWQGMFVYSGATVGADFLSVPPHWCLIKVLRWFSVL